LHLVGFFSRFTLWLMHVFVAAAVVGVALSKLWLFSQYREWAERWTPTEKEEQALLIFERKIFRRTYSPKYENGEWKSRTNRELEKISKVENIVKWIKGQRISWLGHLERVEEDRMPKKVFTQELEGTRRRGRPRKRWKEEAERDLQVLVVRRCRELVADREKWKDIVRQAKAHSGL